MTAPLLEVIASILGTALTGVSLIGQANKTGKDVENYVKSQQDKKQNQQNQQKK